MYKNFSKVRVDLSKISGDTLEENPLWHPGKNPDVIIVRDFTNRMTIKAFESSRALFSYISEKKTSLHEVIIDESRPVKLFFDLDFDKKRLITSDQEILSFIIEAIVEKLLEVASDDFYNESSCLKWVLNNVRIWSACDENKFSYHLVVDQLYFLDMKTMRTFVNQLTPILQDKDVITFEYDFAEKVIDAQYHDEKSLRCPLSEKYNGRFLGRPLKPVYRLDDHPDIDPRILNGYDLSQYDIDQLFESSLITKWNPSLGYSVFVNSENFPELSQEEQITNRKEVLEELPEAIKSVIKENVPLENAQGNYTAHSISTNSKNTFYKNYKISYRRIRPCDPQYCPVCETSHDYNTLYALVNEMSAVMLCSKANNSYSKPRKLLWERTPANKKEEVQLKAFKTYYRIQKEINTTMTSDTPRLHPRIKLHETSKVNQPLLNKEVFSPEADNLVISPMGTGKTKALVDYLGSCARSSPNPKRVLIISFRKSFTDSLGVKYQAWDYRSFQGRIDFDMYDVNRVICQVESLHKINIPKYLDLVIIDEIESVCMQFSNKIMTKNRTLQDCIANLQSLLLVANQVIYMDAFAGERTMAFIEKIGRESPLKITHNTYQPKNKRLELLYKETHFNKALSKALKENKKVVIATTSKNKSKNLKAYIHSEYPKKVVKIYNSETKNSEREALSDPHIAWSQADVLIYTQTISAGISFELDHFDILLGWMTSINSDYITVAQMISRVRNINDYKIYFAGGYNDIPCSEDDLIQYLVNAKVSQNTIVKPYYGERSNAKIMADKLGIQSDYLLKNRDGWYINPNKKDLYYTLWLHNTKVVTKSKNALRKEFLKIFSIYCSEITCPEPTLQVDKDDEGKELNKKHKAIERVAKKEHAKAVSEAPNITKDEYLDLKERIIQGWDLNTSESLAMEKYKIAQIFEKDIQDVKPEDIEKSSNRLKIRAEINKKELREEVFDNPFPNYEEPKELQGDKLTLKERLAKQTKKLVEPSGSTYDHLTYSILFKGERNLAKIQIFNILNKMALAQNNEEDLVGKVYTLEELVEKFGKITSNQLSEMMKELSSYFRENELLLRKLFDIQSCHYPKDGWKTNRSFLGTINKIISELGLKVRSMDRKGKHYQILLQ